MPRRRGRGVHWSGLPARLVPTVGPPGTGGEVLLAHACGGEVSGPPPGRPEGSWHGPRGWGAEQAQAGACGEHR